MPDMNRTARYLTYDFYPEQKGLRALKIGTYVYTRSGSKTAPGVGFELLVPGPQGLVVLADQNSNPPTYRVLIGVMDRDAARQLHKMIGEFLADFPEEAG